MRTGNGVLTICGAAVRRWLAVALGLSVAFSAFVAAPSIAQAQTSGGTGGSGAKPISVGGAGGSGFSGAAGAPGVTITSMSGGASGGGGGAAGGGNGGSGSLGAAGGHEQFSEWRYRLEQPFYGRRLWRRRIWRLEWGD
jgi:hypothetical protein